MRFAAHSVVRKTELLFACGSWPKNELKLYRKNSRFPKSFIQPSHAASGTRSRRRRMLMVGERQTKTECQGIQKSTEIWFKIKSNHLSNKWFKMAIKSPFSKRFKIKIKLCHTMANYSCLFRKLDNLYFIILKMLKTFFKKYGSLWYFTCCYAVY
jgi:hypothetical protein